MTLENMKAIVTGGASGIGLATTEWLGGQGAAVAVLDRDQTALEALVGARGFRVDLGQDVDVRRAVHGALEHLGGLDILVNNAGIGAQGTVEDNDDEEWHRVFDINVLGMVRVARVCVPALRSSSRASIVNVSSVAASVGLPQRALYSATKGAVASLTLAMAADYLPEGIRVNAVAPGTADTPWIGRLLERSDDPDAERKALEARQPHGRLVSPGEIAAAIGYLAGPEAGSTTGTMVVVDGGLSALRLRTQA
jgi:NAD(P)-dependent dehydrogenase (short-subunit alcohol dehydrogenase family)